MIQPDAKCVVNGAKVNEAITALNPLLAMSVGYIGGGKPPQVTYSDGEVKILLPLADSVDGFSLEELDIVDTSNVASSRYFMTSTSSVSTYGTTTASTSGTTTGKQSSAPPTSKDRNSLGNTPNDKNRDQLSMNTGGALRDPSGGVAPPVNVTGGSGMLKWDGNKVVEGSGSNLGGVDEFGNTIGGSGGMLKWDGNKVVEGSGNNLGVAGGMADDGQTAEQSRTNFLANQQRAVDTTPAPLPGAPPQISDTTPPPTPVAPPLSGDSGSGDFSPGSRDYRAMQLNNPEAFAAMEQAEKGAMMNDLPTLSSYLQQMGADLKKHNPEKHQALRQREAELNRKLIWDDLQSLNSYLDQRGEDLKKYNNTEYQKLRARQAELSKQATQGRQ